MIIFLVCRKIKIYRERRQVSIWEYIKYEKYEVLSVINKFNKKYKNISLIYIKSARGFLGEKGNPI